MHQQTPRLDFRSEALVAPTPQMWNVMKQASLRLGMSSLREDEAVRRLEQRMAELTGQEDAIFVPSVTAGTVAAFLAMDVRGRKIILERQSHLWWMQEQHFSVFGGGMAVGLAGDRFGRIPLAALDSELTDQAYGRRLAPAAICLENTHNVCGGTVLDPAYLHGVATLAHASGAALFIDGARIFDAAVAHDVAIEALTGEADVVVISMNKALGAPYGAVICGNGALMSKTRTEASRIGAHQVHKSGIFAAAADLALDNFAPRIARTHRLAGRLAQGLTAISGIRVDLDTVQTNLVKAHITAPGVSQTELVEALARQGVGSKQFLPGVVRFTVHANHDQESIEKAITIVQQVVDSLPRCEPADDSHPITVRR